MKKSVITGICSILYFFMLAQPAYPPAPPAPGNITAFEYFIDNNQNFGSGTTLTGFTPAPDIISYTGTVSLTGVTPGFHRFYIRSKDANGGWSHTSNVFFDNYAVPVYNTAPPAPTNITAIEYFFDNLQNFGSGTPLTGFTPSTNISNYNGTVSLTGVTPGFHRFYIRSKDANGTWSLTNSSALDNYSANVYPNPPAPVVNVVQLEYFIDNNDLGFGNCTQIPFTAGTNVANLNANINITGLPAAVHRLFIRSKDANGLWSITNFSVFDNSAIMPYPVAAGAAPAISNMEYYIDTDPGFGNATAITVPGNTGDISNYAISINLSGSLSVGTHYLYIRSKQNPWAVTNVVPFNASVALPLSWSFVKAQLISNNTLVSWATQQESNTSKFEIEHSIDGRTFIKVGELAAAGNSSTIRNYSFTHVQPVTGFNFYRLKQIDNDGNFKYSVIVTILKKNELKQTILAPNPVKDILHVAEPEQIFIENVEIFSTTGMLLMRKPINGIIQVFSMPVSKLTSGMYILKINYKNESRSYQFVKEY